MSVQKIEEYADKVGKALDLLMPVIAGDKQEFPVYTGEHGNGIVKIDVLSDLLDDRYGANSLITALDSAKIDYTFNPARQEHNGGSYLTIDTKQDDFAQKWEGFVAHFYVQTAAKSTSRAQEEMEKLSLLHEMSRTTHTLTLNPDDNGTPVFIENSWKNAIAYLKKLPLEQQVTLLHAMNTDLTHKTQQLRVQINEAPTTQVEKMALLKPLAGIGNNQRDR
jgi:hypothetical protein